MSEVQSTAEIKQGNVSPIVFHAGETLIRLAKSYPTILGMFLEVAQNAIDAGAKNIIIEINQKHRHATVTDDGDGASNAKFEEALASVCRSSKEQSKLGQFGIGLIAPLGKCQSFTFTSCPRGVSQGFLEWSFVTKDVQAQRTSVEIPKQQLTNYSYRANAKERGKRKSVDYVSWRTKMEIKNYTTDKRVSRLESATEIVDAILSRFGTAMRKKKVRLTVRITKTDGTLDARERITAKAFTGKKLEEVVLFDESAGNTYVRLYLASKTTKGYNGKVLIGVTDNDFRVPFRTFATAMGLFSERLVSALSSGIFEGEILTTHGKLHEDRKRLELNDAAEGFITAIEQWYEEDGIDYLDEVKESANEAKYQELGLTSLEVIQDLVKSLGTYSDVISSFKVGSIGSGHTDPEDRNVIGVGPEKARSVQKQPLDTGRQNLERSDTSATAGELASHKPFNAYGPKGRQRTLVKRNSLGLSYSFLPMEGSDKLWELDAKHGVLHFNMRHPLFVEVDDERGRGIRQLQELITLVALTVYSAPEGEWRDIQLLAFEEMMPSYVYLIKNSTAFNNKRPRPKKDSS